MPFILSKAFNSSSQYHQKKQYFKLLKQSPQINKLTFEIQTNKNGERKVFTKRQSETRVPENNPIKKTRILQEKRRNSELQRLQSNQKIELKRLHATRNRTDKSQTFHKYLAIRDFETCRNMKHSKRLQMTFECVMIRLFTKLQSEYLTRPDASEHHKCDSSI